MFNATLKIRFFIDISWRRLKTLIALVVYLIVTIFKLRNSKIDLNDNFVNNKKIECSQISKLKWYEARRLRKSRGGVKFCPEVLTLKNNVKQKNCSLTGLAFPQGEVDGDFANSITISFSLRIISWPLACFRLTGVKFNFLEFSFFGLILDSSSMISFSEKWFSIPPSAQPRGETGAFSGSKSNRFFGFFLTVFTESGNFAVSTKTVSSEICFSGDFSDIRRLDRRLRLGQNFAHSCKILSLTESSEKLISGTSSRYRIKLSSKIWW